MATQLAAGQYLGATTRRVECGGAMLSEVLHRQGRALPPHGHEASYFCVLLDGGYVEQAGPTVLAYRPFSTAFHPEGLFHVDRIGASGARFFMVDVPRQWSARWDGHFDAALNAAPGFLSHDASLLLARLYGWSRRELVSAELLDSALCELLGDAAGTRATRETRRPGWMNRCVEMLHARIDAPVSIAEVARALDLHPVYMTREFRRCFGRTVGEYSRRMRVRAACRLLADRGRPLAEIAAATGFADQSHFTRLFTAIIGCGPGQYRKLLIET